MNNRQFWEKMFQSEKGKLGKERSFFFFFSKGKKILEQTLNWKARASNKVTLLAYLRLMSVRKEEGLPN